MGAHARRDKLVTVAILLGAAIAALALDQATKWLATLRASVGEPHGGRWGLGLRRLANPRLGRLPLSTHQAALLWLGLAVGVVAVLAAGPSMSVAGVVGLGLSLGGAAGNLADRFRRAAVVDFIVVGPWPAFNVADAAMVAGLVLVAGALL